MIVVGDAESQKANRKIAKLKAETDLAWCACRRCFYFLVLGDPTRLSLGYGDEFLGSFSVDIPDVDVSL